MKRYVSLVLIIAVLGFCGSIYANSNSGLQLQNWYDETFGLAVENVAADHFAGLIQLSKSVGKEQKYQSAEAENELANFSFLISENSVREMENYRKHYIDIANETEEALKEHDFSSLEEEETLKLEAELEADIAEILEEALQ